MIDLSPFLSQIRINQDQTSSKIWCTLRKKWLILTPEEMVRQAAILYLEKLQYPRGRMSIERKIRNHPMDKRYDLVVVNASGSPMILVECKAMKQSIQQATLDQASSYNYAIGSPILWITNGHQNKIFKYKKNHGLSLLDNIPNLLDFTHLEEE